MRIFIISRGYPTKEEPQWGCFEKDQAIALKQLGHEIVFLSVDRRFNIKKITGRESYRYDETFHVYNYRSLLPGSILRKISVKLYCAYYNRILLSLFKKAVKAHGTPDVIFAHYLSNIAISYKLKDKYNIPIVGMEHWSVINRPVLPKFALSLGKIAYPKVDKLLSVSESLSVSIEKHFNQKSTVVNNMVSDDFFIERNCHSSNKDSCFHFISVGSLFPIKGFDLLIDAFYKSGLSKKNCKLTIIGGGQEQVKLQSQIERLSLQNDVFLVGRKTKKEIVSYLQNSNVFVLSSHSETFSVVCIEAMALGLPVIATACGGPEEFVTEEVGVLVKTSDVDAMALAMNEMYENAHEYNQIKIADFCKSNFAPKVIAEKLIMNFEEVLK